MAALESWLVCRAATRAACADRAWMNESSSGTDRERERMMEQDSRELRDAVDVGLAQPGTTA